MTTRKKQDFSDFFEDLSNDSPFLKMAIEGFSGTGKTHLAAVLAIGIHKAIGSEKPIVVYDTERAFRAIKDMFDTQGISVKIRKSRSLTDLGKSFDACECGYSDILIVDSITHVWQDFVESYMLAKSERFNRRVTKLSFPDWAYLKPEWKKRFSDRIVNGKLHVIFTGRAGYEYDHEKDEESGKMTELRKTGIKMKAESETAYEPDILVLMERVEKLLGDNKKIYRTATILKDRYRLIDGQTITDPLFSDFQQVISKALDGTSKKMKEENKDTFDDLNAKNENWQKKRTVILEEIEGIFTQIGLGTSKEDRQIKVDLLDRAFSTTSWTKIQSLKVDILQSELNRLKEFKDKFLSYLEECSRTTEKIDKKMAYQHMEEVWPDLPI